MSVVLFLISKIQPVGGQLHFLTYSLLRPKQLGRQVASLGLLSLLAGAVGCGPAQPAEKAGQVVAVPKPASTPPAPPPAAVRPADSLTPPPSRAADSAKAVAAIKPAPAKPKVPGLRDTIGNALAARLLGGAFNPATLRYRRDPNTPLMLKLARRTTLMVGVNSSENRLYHLFSDARVPAAVRAQPLALDRLSFEPGQAQLGAEAAQQLGNVAALLRTFPAVQLRLSGHSATTEPQFWTLGKERARACLAELLKQGIAPTRLHTEWLAPKAGDPTPQGLSIRLVPAAKPGFRTYPPKPLRPVVKQAGLPAAPKTTR